MFVMKIKNYYKKLNTIALSAIVSMSSSLCLGALSPDQTEEVCKIIANMMDVYTTNLCAPSYVKPTDFYKEQFDELNLKEEDWDETVNVEGIQTTINKELKKYELFFNTCNELSNAQKTYGEGIKNQEASEKLLEPIIIVLKNNTEFSKNAVIQFCLKMQQQAFDLKDDTPAKNNYIYIYTNFLGVKGLLYERGLFLPIEVNKENTSISKELAKFNVVQTLKNALKGRRAKIKNWNPANYIEAITALWMYEADLNAEVPNYGQEGWYIGTVSEVLQSLEGEYAAVLKLKKTSPCTLAWMEDSVYGKTYLIYEFLSLRNASIGKMLDAVKGILGLISKSSDFDDWLGDNEDVNISVLASITLDPKEVPATVWDLKGDIPCDKFFELLIQIAKHLELQQKNIKAGDFCNQIYITGCPSSDEKNILKTLFTYCVLQNDPGYNELKKKLTTKGILPQSKD